MRLRVFGQNVSVFLHPSGSHWVAIGAAPEIQKLVDAFDIQEPIQADGCPCQIVQLNLLERPITLIDGGIVWHDMHQVTLRLSPLKIEH